MNVVNVGKPLKQSLTLLYYYTMYTIYIQCIYYYKLENPRRRETL